MTNQTQFNTVHVFQSEMQALSKTVRPKSVAFVVDHELDGLC